MQLAQLLHIAGGVGLIDLHGLQTHGAILHAAATADAGIDLCGLCSCLAQQDQTGSGLGGGVGKVLHSGAHHGTAGNHLAQLALDAHIVQNEGEGKNGFHDEFVLLKTKLNDQEDNLREMALMLEKIALRYEEFDTDVSSQIESSTNSKK